MCYQGSTVGSFSAECKIWPSAWSLTLKGCVVSPFVLQSLKATTRDGSRVLVVDSDKGIKVRALRLCIKLAPCSLVLINARSSTSLHARTRGHMLNPNDSLLCRQTVMFTLAALSSLVFDWLGVPQELSPLPESDAVTSVGPWV